MTTVILKHTHILNSTNDTQESGPGGAREYRGGWSEEDR